MYNDTHTKSIDWPTEIRTGDIVSFRFPHAEACAEAEREAQTSLPKVRPCLVLSRQWLGDLSAVQIAYGTSARTSANRGHEINVRRPEDRAAAGLNKRTRFICARHLIVPLTHSGFISSSATGSPILGHLPARLIPLLDRLRDRLRADQGIEVAYQAEPLSPTRQAA